MLPDTLCPWGCTGFCFRTSHCNPALLIQHHLRKDVLNMPHSSMYADLFTVETSRQDYLRDEMDYDHVMLNDEWPVLPTVARVPGKGLMVLVCRHHSDSRVRKRLYPHPPRKPDHNLSAEKTNQLSPCVVIQRTAALMRARAFNTTFSMKEQVASYSGIDSMNIGTTGQFNSISPMLKIHELLSIACRSDIKGLAAIRSLLLPHGECGVVRPGPHVSCHPRDDHAWDQLVGLLRAQVVIRLAERVRIQPLPHPRIEVVVTCQYHQPRVRYQSNGWENRPLVVEHQVVVVHLVTHIVQSRGLYREEVGVNTAQRHVQHGLAQVVLYEQRGVAMGSPETKLRATPRAQRVRKHAWLLVLWVHRA